MPKAPEQTSLSIEPEDFSCAPFDQRGLGEAPQLFGTEIPSLLDELNEELAA